ncbi:isocitrate lyase/phosphoenolpyruvate mutase family protein [Aestuariibius sp. 2305UL40-4]|uniref:isocitrate lyase/PEP mutase family protein n=1 Tax=Aestuariibius violaceus TaxID=3234132 RepID=UPI00345EEECF
MTDIGATFRALHVPGDPFLMVNVWDAGTAKVMAAMGAQALATSSAALAYILGRPDGGTVTRDEALAHAQDIAAATPLPVQGDFENGFGEAPDICAETVRLAAEAGLAGICIEDTALPDQSAYDRALAVERIRAAAAAARALPKDFVLTARADGLLTGAYDEAEATARLQAFEEAGADCLYAPLPPDMDALARLTAAVNAPVNALVVGAFAKEPRSAYAEIGVARLSLGSALARATQRTILEAAEAMFGGDFTPLTRTAPSSKIDAMLTGS